MASLALDRNRVKNFISSCKILTCFSVEYLPEMLQCESYKRRMMAVMSLEVICLAKDEYWQYILDAGNVKFINYLLLMLLYAKLYYIQLITVKSIFNCGGNILVDFKFLFFFFLRLFPLPDNITFYFPQDQKVISIPFL